MLYFAYGSNMSVKRMKKRVRAAKLQGTASLAEHQLRFHKVSRDGSAKCDVIYTREAEDVVYGLLYEMSEEDQEILDRAEGLGKGYERTQVTVVDSLGKEIQAFTYYATEINESLSPYHWYKNHVVRGAEEAGLPQKYLMMLFRVKSKEDPDAQQAYTENSLYKKSESETNF